jgi:hypothetical protein
MKEKNNDWWEELTKDMVIEGAKCDVKVSELQLWETDMKIQRDIEENHRYYGSGVEAAKDITFGGNQKVKK